MEKFKSVHSDGILMGRLPNGCDLLESLNNLCAHHGVKLGRVEVIGAVQKARIGFYNQARQVYEFTEYNRPLEITCLLGNVSCKDEKPFVHAHVTLADETGACVGGHLAPGTVVFAAEFIVETFRGPLFLRDVDQETGLPLWQL